MPAFCLENMIPFTFILSFLLGTWPGRALHQAYFVWEPDEVLRRLQLSAFEQVAWPAIGTLLIAGALGGFGWYERNTNLVVLVIGGAQGQTFRWEEERLRAEVHALRQQGLSASQIGRQLAARSGWPRRDVYQLAVQDAPPGADME